MVFVGITMLTSKLKYRKGYKYQLAADLVYKTNLRPIEDASSESGRIKLHTDGILLIKEGYAFDGPSGPIIDRDSNMAASGVHDGLYQLMREQALPHKYWREADYEYAKVLGMCGSWRITINYSLWGLKKANGRAALPKNRKKVYEAPLCIN